MGTYKAGQQNNRTLQKNNTGTYSVTVPIELVRQLKWQTGQKLVLEKRGKTIVIADWKK
jgi:antitoxin component of MazEF toxin-antitoxin module